jgi:hypothetical protein
VKGGRIFCRVCQATTPARKVQIHQRGGAIWGSECTVCGVVHPSLAPGLAYRRGRQRAIKREIEALESGGQLKLFDNNKGNNHG